MKTLIFSDSHLTNKFDLKKFNFLKKIISKADKIIINGDFWEGYECSFDEFIDSPWKKLFTLLKKKGAIYLYGNHDKKKFSNKKTRLFSRVQKTKYKLKSGNNIFYIEHGDKLAPLLDDKLPIYPKTLNHLLDRVEGLLFKLFGNLHLYIFFKSLNQKIKKQISGKLKSNEYLVCGHTNFAEIDLKRRFINSGFIKHGIAQYLIVEDGKIILRREKY